MLNTSIPPKFTTPWASGAGATYRRFPPVSAAGPVASQTLGFPPATAVDPAAGGTPPNIADMNGVLFHYAQWLQWLQAGAPVPFDATFAAAIGGYPRGAIVPSTVTVGKNWVSLVDANNTNPDSPQSQNWADQTIRDLGFTPVQQGGGTAQTANKIYLGWDPALLRPRIQIDQTDLGGIPLLQDFASSLLINGYQKIVGTDPKKPLIIQWQSQIVTTQTPTTINFPTVFPNGAFGTWASIGSSIPGNVLDFIVGAQPVNLGQFVAMVASTIANYPVGCWFLSLGF